MSEVPGGEGCLGPKQRRVEKPNYDPWMGSWPHRLGHSLWTAMAFRAAVTRSGGNFAWLLLCWDRQVELQCQQCSQIFETVWCSSNQGQESRSEDPASHWEHWCVRRAVGFPTFAHHSATRTMGLERLQDWVFGNLERPLLRHRLIQAWSAIWEKPGNISWELSHLTLGLTKSCWSTSKVGWPLYLSSLCAKQLSRFGSLLQKSLRSHSCKHPGLWCRRCSKHLQGRHSVRWFEVSRGRTEVGRLQIPHVQTLWASLQPQADFGWEWPEICFIYVVTLLF